MSSLAQQIFDKANAMNLAFRDGLHANHGQRNPYEQRDGELWRVANQDALYDAWRRGNEASREGGRP